MVINKAKHSITVFVTLLITLTITATVYAAFISINTNDALVDSNWGTAFMTDTSGDGPDAARDIISVWVGSDQVNPTEFYFRMQTLSGVIPSNSSALAELDCNNNSSFDDAEDIQVYYVVSGDRVDVYSGNWVTYWGSDSTYGEQIGNEVEWSAAVNGGTTNWSACLDAIQIQFSIITLGLAQDITTLRSYNVPSAVTTQSIKSTSLITFPWLIGIVCLIVLGLILLNKKT